MSVEETGELLVSLPGVSEKVAKCIMMYTLNHRVLPVDVHVHRVVSRLGWTKRKRADQCHQELESLVPPRWRYAFHVGCVLHGRAVCRAQKPLCGNCSIATTGTSKLNAHNARPVAADLCCGGRRHEPGVRTSRLQCRCRNRYRANSPGHAFQNLPSCQTWCTDLSLASGAELRKHTGLVGKQISVIFAGPPCQGFSLIGKRRREDPATCSCWTSPSYR